MAYETLKMLILSKLPRRQVCTPQVMELLFRLNEKATSFHMTVTVTYRKLPPDKRKAVLADPRMASADKLVREVMAKLRDNGVNLFGFDSMDFCEAFVEVYKAYAASH